MVVGIKEVYVFDKSGPIELVGYGWHPREHETYCFLLSEPNPGGGLLRYVHVELEGDGSFRFGLLLDRQLVPGEDSYEGNQSELFTGSAKINGRRSWGKYILSLDQRELRSADGKAIKDLRPDCWGGGVTRTVRLSVATYGRSEPQILTRQPTALPICAQPHYSGYRSGGASQSIQATWRHAIAQGNVAVGRPNERAERRSRIVQLSLGMTEKCHAGTK